MKHLKMFGLAAIAATALTAIVGVGSASAVTLCENNQATTCTSHVNAGGTVDFSAEDSIKLAGPFGIVLDTCTESTMIGTTSNTGADDEMTPVSITITKLTFSGCTRPMTVGQGGTLSISGIKGTGNGTITSSGLTWTVHELPNIVGNPSTCSYATSNTPVATLTASATASTWDIAATFVSETPQCFAFTWSGNYAGTGTVIRAIAH